MLLLPKKFIVFGHARSGSSTLKTIFQSQKIKIIGEPFNPDVTLAYLKTDFKSAISEIFKEYQSLKHLFHQLDEEKNTWLIQKYPTIFLYRKNLLQAAFSSELAIQTKVWDVHDSTKEGLATLYKQIGSIDINVVKTRIEEFRTQKIYYENKLNKNYKVSYEDLYSENWKFYIQEIFDFLKCKIIDYSEIEKLISKSNKLNNYDLYTKIENLEEIKTLESVENGFLNASF